MPNVTEAILNGLRSSVDLHWRLSKELIRIKPEYLLTVSVAHELSKGFNGRHGMDVSIKLEEPTQRIVAYLWLNTVGWTKYFKKRKSWRGRGGRVDIFVEHEDGCHVVEIKNFNPSASEVKKELTRFRDLLIVNGGVNSLQSCHLAFPAHTDKEAWLQKQIDSLGTVDLRTEINRKYVVTGEDPEDGIPAYYCYVVSCVQYETTNK